MPQKCPCPSTYPLAQTVYPLQGGKVHPHFENKKKFRQKIFLASTTTRKICCIHWWNPFLNPLTMKGDICNFVTALSALSNTSQHSVYNYARRPILRTGQHLPCASFSSLLLIFGRLFITRVTNAWPAGKCGKWRIANSDPQSCRLFGIRRKSADLPWTLHRPNLNK